MSEVEIAMHRAYVDAVKKIQKSHPFAVECWLQYLHDWAPPNPSFLSLSRDPQVYSLAFLGDFIKWCSGKAYDAAALNAFAAQGGGKRQRGTPLLDAIPSRRAVCNELFIVVGAPFADGGMAETLDLQEVGVTYREVSLVLANVVHSGVATAHVMAALDSGALSQAVQVIFPSDVRIIVIHCESGFRQFPRSRFEPVHTNRFDNMLHVLRAAGVDASATQAVTGRAVRKLFDQRWHQFVGVGVLETELFPQTLRMVVFAKVVCGSVQ